MLRFQYLNEDIDIPLCADLPHYTLCFIHNEAICMNTCICVHLMQLLPNEVVHECSLVEKKKYLKRAKATQLLNIVTT